MDLTTNVIVFQSQTRGEASAGLLGIGPFPDFPHAEDRPARSLPQRLSRFDPVVVRVGLAGVYPRQHQSVGILLHECDEFGHVIDERAAPGALNAEHRGDSTVQLEQEAFTAMSVAQIVVDADGTLALANRLARTMFDLDGKDLGRPFRDLDVSFQPVELRSLIDRARIEGAEVVRRGVERALPLEGTQYLDVQVRPLHDPYGAFLGAVISFDDTTQARQAQSELRHASEELQNAHEELHS